MKSPFEVGVFVLELLTEGFFRVHRVFIFLGRSEGMFYFDAALALKHRNGLR